MLLAAEALLIGTPGVSAAPARKSKVASTASSTTSSSPPTYWVPTQNTTWQIQLGGTVNANVNVDAIEIDADTDVATVKKLKDAGKKVIAYISGGSFEDWRDDKDSFPASVIGKPLDGWDGENWLDVTNLAALRPIMKARAQAAKAKGFDGIDWDNMDGYTQDSGYKISFEQQITYNTMLAQIAHELNMGVALKNDLDQAARLAGVFDWAVNESCSRYQECNLLTPFLNIGKAVVGLEYPGFNGDSRNYKQVAAQTDTRTYTLIKNQSLDSWGIIVRNMKNIS